MIKLKRSLTAKIVAFILLAVFAITALGSGVGSIYCLSENYYTKELKDVKQDFYDRTCYEISSVIYQGVYFGSDGKPYVQLDYVDRVTGLADFTVSNTITNKILYEKYSGNTVSYLAEVDNYFNVYYDGYYSSEDTELGELKISVKLKPFKNTSIYYFLNNFYEFIFKNRFVVIINFIICTAISFMLFCFLIAAAGHKNGVDGIVSGFIEKIPFDIFTAVITAAIGVIGIFCIELCDNYFGYFSFYTSMEQLFLVFGAILLLLLVASTVFVIWSMSFAKRVKLKVTIKSCILYKLLKFIFSKLKTIFKFIAMLIKNLSLVWKVALIILGISFIELLVLFLSDYLEYYVFLSVLEKVFFIPLVIFIAILLQRLKFGGKKLSEGSIENKINTDYMFGDFKEHAENLNSIGVGVATAVEEKLKSERFKTELITNVSHDIKTPLTSVINYVDLIKQEKPEGEKINEYLEVLERQSNRLKKLIEDLVEASKASSGSLSVELVPCEGNILLEQMAGEYEDKFKSNDLRVIIKKSNEPLMINADSRHLGRVFDNLLNNIYKHAMPGSRVYLSLQKIGYKAEFCFKNISKYELDISAEELTERFVRADKSRNTEGSGLGLSIAKSLTELQNGEFKIITDGDLFKVFLLFKLI